MDLLFHLMKNLLDTTGYRNRSAELLAKNKDLNFIRRINEGNDLTLDFVDNEGKPASGTHYMANDKYDGKQYVYPTIVQKPGKKELEHLKEKAFDYAIETGEYIDAGEDPDFALYFASAGYKQNFPEDVYNEAVQNYIDNTNIKKKE